MSAETFVGTEYSRRQDGYSRSAGDHPNASLRFLKFTVVCSGAFRKEEQGIAFSQKAEYALDGLDVAVPIPVHGDGVQVGDQLAEESSKERTASEEVNRARQAANRDGRIKKTSVVDC